MLSTRPGAEFWVEPKLNLDDRSFHSRFGEAVGIHQKEL